MRLLTGFTGLISLFHIISHTFPYKNTVTQIPTPVLDLMLCAPYYLSKNPKYFELQNTLPQRVCIRACCHMSCIFYRNIYLFTHPWKRIERIHSKLIDTGVTPGEGEGAFSLIQSVQFLERMKSFLTS